MRYEVLCKTSLLDTTAIKSSVQLRRAATILRVEGKASCKAHNLVKVGSIPTPATKWAGIQVWLKGADCKSAAYCASLVRIQPRPPYKNITINVTINVTNPNKQQVVYRLV